MVYTKHALERMAERGINRATIMAVVINGEKRAVEEGKTAYIFMDYVVVMSKEDHVITVFSRDEFSPAWGPKKARQKRAQDIKRHRRNSKRQSGYLW